MINDCTRTFQFIMGLPIGLYSCNTLNNSLPSSSCRVSGGLGPIYMTRPTLEAGGCIVGAKGLSGRISP